MLDRAKTPDRDQGTKRRIYMPKDFYSRIVGGSGVQG